MKLKINFQLGSTRHCDGVSSSSLSESFSRLILRSGSHLFKNLLTTRSRMTSRAPVESRFITAKKSLLLVSSQVSGLAVKSNFSIAWAIFTINKLIHDKI